MLWQDADSLKFALESCYTRIQSQRMADIPIINPKLHVQAVGFGFYEQVWLGVLITPWFMNILLLGDKTELPIATKVTRSFPAGNFEFIVSHEEAIGYYQSCSLYSPMFAFEEQYVAVQTAKSALRSLLMPPENPQLSRRDLLRGQFSKRNTL